MDRYTDIHCHILPGLDDGAVDIEDSIYLARKLRGWGFRKAVCTPHRQRLYRNTPQIVTEACYLLQERLDALSMDLRLIPSMEYRIIPETWPETVRNDWFLPFEGDHILVELPISNPARVGDLVPEDEIRRVRDMGYIPILAHPERYLYCDMERYRSLKEAGALFQRNVGSMEGLYGYKVAGRAILLRDHGMYDVIGTDLHSERYARFFDSFSFSVDEYTL